MGCDIHSFAEVRKDGKWELVGDVFPLDDFDKEWYGKDYNCEPFLHRNYRLFAWLAGVRNYSDIEPISEPKGLPDDLSGDVEKDYKGWKLDGHSASHLSLNEMLNVDYDVEIWDRRVAEDGEGNHMTLREFLGTEYFETLDILKTLGDPEDVRVVFWFDN